jgi:hypothetical protein
MILIELKLIVYGIILIIIIILTMLAGKSSNSGGILHNYVFLRVKRKAKYLCTRTLTARSSSMPRHNCPSKQTRYYSAFPDFGGRARFIMMFYKSLYEYIRE